MKKIKLGIFTIIISFLYIINVSAATGSINASSSASTVTVGSTFTVTVNVSCSETIGSWQFGVTYDDAYLNIISGNENLAVKSYGDGTFKSKSYTYKFQAKKSGNTSIRITGAGMVTWDDVNTLFTPSTSNTSVTIKTQAEIQASYSKDNNLKSLSIDGYELTPEFNKDTLEYKTEVPDDVKSIKVNASVNDSTARVRGTGEIELSEGANKIEVVVTAQNGNTKTYTINVTVKDLTPINVTLDNKEYSVIKKAELLTGPTGYNPTTIKINDIDIPAYTSDITKLTLVGLKDDNGNTELYIYDNNNYKKYTEITSVGLNLYPLTPLEVPIHFEKTTIKINNNDYDAFISTKEPKTTIIYAQNTLTGYKGYYTYDKDENTFIRYNANMFEAYKNQNEEYKFYLLIAISIAVIFFLLTLILAIKNSHLKKILFTFSKTNK